MAELTELETHISILVIYFFDENTSPNVGNSKAHQHWMNSLKSECEGTLS